MRKLAVMLIVIALVIAVPIANAGAIPVTTKISPPSPGAIRGFDPQPDPPSEYGFTTPGTIRGFNPQPDPPRVMGDGSV